MSSLLKTSSLEIPSELLNISKTDYIHKTWANTFQCKPQRFFQPNKIEEIKLLINYAKKFNKSLMTIGSGHSPSDMTMTNQWLINLDKLNQILDVNFHKSGKFADITVEAGIRIFELNEILNKDYDLALQNLGSITDQSIAGLISTGSHGSTAFQGILSRQIVDLTIIDGNGNLVYCSSEKNKDIFKAALLSLGKIGIIVKATIRVVPSFRIKSFEEIISFEEMLNSWETVWTSSEFIRIWWYPYVNKCILWRGSKTLDQANSNNDSIKKKESYLTKLWKYLHELALLFVVKLYPSLTPTLSRFVFNHQYGHLAKFNHIKEDKKLKEVIEESSVIQTSFDGFSLDCLFSQYVDEWAAPLNNGPEILRLLKHSFIEASNKSDFYIHDPVEIRCSNNTTNEISIEGEEFEKFIESRDSIDIGSIDGNNLKPYLEVSPNLYYVGNFSQLNSKKLSSSTTTIHELDKSNLNNKSFKVSDNFLDTPITNITNSQLTLYLNLVIYRPFGYDAPYGKFFKIFEDILVAAEGKPHWAKNFIGGTQYLPKGIVKKDKYEDGEMIGFAEKVKEWYGSDLKEFQKIRRDLDPNNLFLSGKDWAIKNGIVEPDE